MNEIQKQIAIINGIAAEAPAATGAALTAATAAILAAAQALTAPAAQAKAAWQPVDRNNPGK